MSGSFERRRVFACAWLGMLVFGVVLTALGAILPSVITRFHLGRTDAGALLSLMSLGVLLGSVIFGPVVDRSGYRAPLAVAIALVAVGLEGVAFAPGLGALRAAILVVGFGGGVINGGTNALVADVSAGERSAGLSLLGVFFGVGALGVPLLVGSLAGRVSPERLLGLIGAAVLVVVLVVAATAFPAPKQAQGFPVAAGLRLLREPALLAFGALLFLQSGIEITLGGWTSSFLKDELAIPEGRAVALLSLYWVAMTAARLLLGGALRRVAPQVVLRGAMATAFVGALALIAARTPALAAAGIVLCGGGLAAGFPVILGFVGDRFASLSGTAFSVALVMALCGGTLLPYLTGALAESAGLRLSLVIVPVALALQAVLFEATRRFRRTDARP